MMDNKDLTISAYIKFVKALKDSPDTSGFEFTTSVFNSSIGIRNLCSGAEVADMPELNDRNYRPDAAAPLYDAIGKDHPGRRGPSTAGRWCSGDYPDRRL